MTNITATLAVPSFTCRQYRDDAGCWNPSSWKTRTHSLQIVTKRAAADLVTRGVMVSADIVLV